MKLTYAQARKRLFTQLESDGWTVTTYSTRTSDGRLKVPYATSPASDCKLWFKPQAVHMSDDRNTLGNARSLWIDIRTISDDNLPKMSGYFDRQYQRS